MKHALALMAATLLCAPALAAPGDAAAAKALFEDVLRALAACHARCVLHRVRLRLRLLALLARYARATDERRASRM
jgi:hypothetical protein